MNTLSDLHGAHPYPCKYPAQSIGPFVENGGDILLDPFCGSGTTVLEGAVRGWNKVYGFDSNPIAILISQFKTLSTNPRFFKLGESLVADFLFSVQHTKVVRPLNFEGATHWFARHVLSELERIIAWIDQTEEVRVKVWLRLALSRIINRVSRQDSETRYVAVDRKLERNEVFDRFLESAAYTLSLLRKRPKLSAATLVETADIQAGLPLEENAVSRIVCSPPYANSMDYYLYHKQRMNVLGFDFKKTQNVEIGSRHEYSSQRAPAEKWAADYRWVLSEFRRVLKPGGDAIIVIGDSQIAGQKLDAAELTRHLGLSLGLHVDVIDSVSLQGRSRSFSRGFQRPNKSEHVVQLRKLAGPRSNEAILVVPISGRAQGGIPGIAAAD